MRLEKGCGQEEPNAVFQVTSSGCVRAAFTLLHYTLHLHTLHFSKRVAYFTVSRKLKKEAVQG